MSAEQERNEARAEVQSSTNPILEEIKWLREVYKGDKLPEVTLKAVLLGLILGVFMVALNVYMGLKTGWGEGGSIISAILAFSIMFVITKVIRGLQYSILENNITQTIASAAGSIGNIVNVIPALFLLGYELTNWEIFAWVFFTSFLGVLFAVPLRKQMVVAEKLTFPTGTACAETLKALHFRGGSSEEAKKSLRRSGLLAITGALSSLFTLLRDSWRIIPGVVYLPGEYFKGLSFKELTTGLSLSPMMLAIGLLVGMRVALSMLIGGAIAWLVIAPWLVSSGIATHFHHVLSFNFSLEVLPEVSLSLSNPSLEYHAVTNWTMWAGTTIMVVTGLISLFFKWNIIVRSLTTIGKLKVDLDSEELKGVSEEELRKLASLEIPFSWWVFLLALASIAVVAMMKLVFNIPVWMGILAIILSFILALVAVRATGETDINPVGAMGHVTQIVYGILAPGKTVTNLMTAGVTAAGASESADMMQDLKTGYLVGATPKRQMMVQFLGVIVGAISAVFIFIAIKATYGIATPEMPAPAAVVWKGFAELLAEGMKAMPPGAPQSVLVGALIGLAIGLLENLPATAKYKKYLPSPIGLGIGLIIPFYYSVSIFLGALAKVIIDSKYGPKAVEEIDYPVGSGMLAGEGVTGALLAIWRTFIRPYLGF